MQSNGSMIQDEILRAGFGRDSFVFEVLRRFFNEEKSLMVDFDRDLVHRPDKKKRNILVIFSW